MKSINKKIIVTILVIIEIMLINITYKSYSNRIIDEKEIENKRVAIKVDNGNNEYKDSETLPGRGYVLNTELTECLDIEGNKIENIKLDSNGENITITGRYTSYCTIYYYLPENREYDYTGDYQVFIAPKEGNYKIELWGASGGDFLPYYGGRGAYTKGTIELEKNDKLYLFVGSDGSDRYAGGYNGGGISDTFQYRYGAFGGGATDIRLDISSTGNWDDFDSLKSRIMVAAGGGGANNRNDCDKTSIYGAGNGGYGGALIGGDGQSVDYLERDGILSYGAHAYGTGGTQTNGGIRIVLDSNKELIEGDYSYATGYFGFCSNIGVQSGAGNGYYCGGSSHHGGGGGGSSYISGYTGCVAISEESTEDNVQPKDGCTDGTQEITCSYHFSNKVFTSTEMKSGNEEMPTHNGNGNMTGNTGNGYAKITFIE